MMITFLNPVAMACSETRSRIALRSSGVRPMVPGRSALALLGAAGVEERRRLPLGDRLLHLGPRHHVEFDEGLLAGGRRSRGLFYGNGLRGRRLREGRAGGENERGDSTQDAHHVCFSPVGPLS